MSLKKVIIASLLFTSVSLAPVQAQSFDSVTHIHGVKAMGKKALIGTHEGLFVYVGPNNMKAVGAERFDVMGLTIFGDTIYASGHPGKGSKLPEPVGLLRSTDGGLNWKKISLQGKVDFHFLVSGKTELYGADAKTGVLMYSANAGKSWKNIGANTYADIAPTNSKNAHAYGVREGKLYKTSNAFVSETLIASKIQIEAIETMGSSLFMSSGKSIYQSVNEGKDWKKLFTFKDKVGDISASNTSLVAIVGREILISTDRGKSFKS